MNLKVMKPLFILFSLALSVVSCPSCSNTTSLADNSHAVNDSTYRLIVETGALDEWCTAEAIAIRIGLVNVAAEPFMDFGAAWDNEYVSLHMIEPDYQPMVGYPIAHTPGTSGKVTADAVIVDLQTREDIAAWRGKLGGKAVLATPPSAIDMAPLVNGTPRYTEDELTAREQTVIELAR